MFKAMTKTDWFCLGFAAVCVAGIVYVGVREEKNNGKINITTLNQVAAIWLTNEKMRERIYGGFYTEAELADESRIYADMDYYREHACFPEEEN